jgi:hypothetical protein
VTHTKNDPEALLLTGVYGTGKSTVAAEIDIRATALTVLGVMGWVSDDRPQGRRTPS